MEMSNMSPTKRILLKRSIDQSNENSKYAAVVKHQYPLFRIQYQITRDYLDLPGVNKYYAHQFPLDDTYIDISINILCHIKKQEDQTKGMDYIQIREICQKIIDNNIGNSFLFLDSFTKDYCYKYQHLNSQNELFNDIGFYTEKIFDVLFKQLKCLHDHSLNEEISGDVYSKLIVLIWKIIGDSFFQFELEDREISHNVILIEFLIQLNSTISPPHEYKFQTQNVFGYKSPLVKLFEGNLYVEFKLKDSDDFILNCISCYSKNEGVGAGYIYEIMDFRIYCKELFVHSDFYFDRENDQIKLYLESMKTRKSSTIAAKDHFYPYSERISHFDESFHIRKKNDVKPSGCQTDWVSICFDSKNYEFQNDRIQKTLKRYINAYAESVSYILLYYFGFMPSLSVIKSIITNKIYLMIDQVPLVDEEFGSEYHFGYDFYIDRHKFHGRKLNNLCACLHTFLLFNYLFHLGDFHDGNYSICSKGDKFKILIFDMWMSPFQIRANDVINFSGNPGYDEIHHLNSSLAYYLLFNDRIQNIEADSIFSISKLITSLEGEKRLPFITIKSLKKIFSNAIKNIDKIFHSENTKEELFSQLIVYNRSSKNKTLLSSNYIIEKIYDSSREILLKNQFLVDEFMDYISIEDYQKYYTVDDKDKNYFMDREEDDKINSHEYLVKFSTQKLTTLYEKLLEIPQMDMIFLKNPSNYLVYGSSDLIIAHKKYKKSFATSPFSEFIRKPSNIDYIFVFFSVDQNINNYFEDSSFSETKNIIIRDKLSSNEKCLFIVFNDIVLCDMYRIHLINQKFIQDSISDKYYHSLLFSYKRSAKKIVS